MKSRIRAVSLISFGLIIFLAGAVPAVYEGDNALAEWVVNLLWEATEDSLDFVSSDDFPKLYYGIRNQSFDDASSTAFREGLNFLDDVVYFATSVDEFEDDYIDPGIWTTGVSGLGSVVEEENGQLRVHASYGDAWAIADGPNATDYKYGSKDKEIIMCMTISTQAGYCEIHLSDGSNRVQLDRFSSYKSGLYYYKLEIHDIGMRVDVYRNGVQKEANIDLASLSRWNLEFRSWDSADSSAIRINWIRHVIGEGNPSSFYSETKETDESITGAALYAKADVNGGSFDYYLSADNGTHYEPVGLGQFHTFSYPGNQVKVKIVGTEPSFPNATMEDNTPILRAWAIAWNPSWFRQP